MRVKELYKGLFLVTFPTQRELAKAFLRFQEHYESPNAEFTKRGFTLTEFKAWYRKRFGKFNYYSFWTGFNLPGTILQSFYDGKFIRLSPAEKQILKYFEGQDLSKIYIIGTSGDNGHAALEHETAHGFFFLDERYRAAVTHYVQAFRPGLTELHAKLKSMGYADSVLVDEAHAYVLCEEEFLAKHKILIMGETVLRGHLRREFRKVSERLAQLYPSGATKQVAQRGSKNKAPVRV